jgi:hypothetical protein
MIMLHYMMGETLIRLHYIMGQSHGNIPVYDLMLKINVSNFHPDGMTCLLQLQEHRIQMIFAPIS